MPDELIAINLTKDEALVLFDWLARNDAANLEHDVLDEAERKALWILEGLLESILVEPLRPDYDDLLKQARKRLVDAAPR